MADSAGPACMADLIRAGDLAAVQAAIRANPSALNAADDLGDTPLILACQADAKQREIAAWLVESGAAVDQQCGEGWSPLMLACDAGQSETAAMLVRSGAALDLQNRKGETALLLAARSGDAAAVKLLLDNGASLELADAAGDTALHAACQHAAADGANLESLELLLAKATAAQLAATNGKGLTPAALGAALRRADVAALFEAAGSAPSTEQ